jgi:hypothetical protein
MMRLEFDFSFAPHWRDPGGGGATYHTACDDLIREEQVEHIVGCYTSASRKYIIPIVERTERLLWHLARYEGFESSDNVIDVGAAPNHTVVPLARHMLEHISIDVFGIGIVRLRPSKKPARSKPSRNAFTCSVTTAADSTWRNPITGFAGCCAPAASGQVAAAAPPTTLRNSRRLMSTTKPVQATL